MPSNLSAFLALAVINDESQYSILMHGTAINTHDLSSKECDAELACCPLEYTTEFV